jgi:hypothetical protein
VLRAIAAGREERIPAARGGKWSTVQVSRLLETARQPFRRKRRRRRRVKGNPLP